MPYYYAPHTGTRPALYITCINAFMTLHVDDGCPTGALRILYSSLAWSLQTVLYDIILNWTKLANLFNVTLWIGKKYKISRAFSFLYLHVLIAICNLPYLFAMPCYLPVKCHLETIP